MSKYYKVQLNEKFVGYKSEYLLKDDNYIICKLSTNTFYQTLIRGVELIFREIITNKNVYPSSDTNVRGLTYEIVCEKFGSQKRILNQIEEITAIEVQEWLKNMDEKSLKAYVERINELETQAIEYYEKEKKEIRIKESRKKRQ